MSDLAPFVAAAIRDNVVVELQKENKQLREHLSAIKLTGANGIPCYATAHIEDCSTRQGEETNQRICQFKVVEGQEGPKSALDLANAELWVGSLKHNTPLGKWEHSFLMGARQDQGQSYFQFKIRDWESPLCYKEMAIEAGPYPAGNNPAIAEGVSTFTIADGSFFVNEAGQAFDPAPEVKFLSITLHEPSEEVALNG